MEDVILRTPFVNIHTRSIAPADTDLLDPNNANPLVLGEWLEFDSSYKLARGTGDATVPSFMFFQERGAYDTQALGKIPALFVGQYECDTKIMLATGLSVGSPLMVADVTIGSLTKRGLKLNDSIATKYTVGYVTRLPASNNNYLRFYRVK